ncbi:hypothetical protein YB2330_005835 [Saitoella coloradoensis]
MTAIESTEAIAPLTQPLTLQCGLTLPNRLVKCPMQETLASPPFFDPPIDSFRRLYGLWATSSYGLLITGQVQIDSRHISTPTDVCVREKSLEEPVLGLWKEWAKVAQSGGTPCVVQLAHPGRMAANGTGTRKQGEPALSPSGIKLELGKGKVERFVIEKTFGTPKAMDEGDIEDVVARFVRGAVVAKKAGFAGVQLHAAHGFLLSQYLNPKTNIRTDEYGGSTSGRLFLLTRLIEAIRRECPPPFCLSVKLNSADFQVGGLTEDEAIEYVRYLCECGHLDFIEISGGNAESIDSPLHNSLRPKGPGPAKDANGVDVKQIRESTKKREAYFSGFADRIHDEINPRTPIQLSGGWRSRLAMAEAIKTGTCDLIGLGRTAVITPTLPASIILNPSIPDDCAQAPMWEIRGLWITRYLPPILTAALPINFFYFNMQRLGCGLEADGKMDVVVQTVKNVVWVLGKQVKVVVEVGKGWLMGVYGSELGQDAMKVE